MERSLKENSRIIFRVWFLKITKEFYMPLMYKPIIFILKIL